MKRLWGVFAIAFGTLTLTQGVLAGVLAYWIAGIGDNVWHGIPLAHLEATSGFGALICGFVTFFTCMGWDLSK